MKAKSFTDHGTQPQRINHEHFLPFLLKETEKRFYLNKVYASAGKYFIRNQQKVTEFKLFIAPKWLGKQPNVLIFTE